MLAPEKLKKAFQKVEDENWMLRAFLKGQDEDELDELVHSMHQELFQSYNCISCSNCCKEIVPIIEDNEIQAISLKLGISFDEFSTMYLVETEEGLSINKKPCPFLTNEGCSIYECRPNVCKEYPYTDKEEICTRLINLVGNSEVCPVVFEIFEKLKKHYGNEFEEYK